MLILLVGLFVLFAVTFVLSFTVIFWVKFFQAFISNKTPITLGGKRNG